MFTLAFHRSSPRPIATTSSGDPPSTNPNLKIEIAQTGWQVPPDPVYYDTRAHMWKIYDIDVRVQLPTPI